MANNNVCRVCLKLSSFHHYIFENDIAKMLGSVMNKPVVPNFEIPSVICITCLVTLKMAFKFKEKAKKNEEKLLEEAKLAPKIKLHEKQEEHKDVVDIFDSACLVCGEECETNSINNHTRNHFYQAQICEICGKCFYNVREFRTHLRTVKNHENKKIYQCGQCNTKFLYKTFYDVHRKLVCVYGEDSMEVISIKEEIVDRSNIVQEKTKRRKLNKVSKLKFCEICSKDVPVGHNHNLRSCTICRRLISRSNYYKHVKSHNSQKQICHLCGKPYANMLGLKDHIKRQHENKKKIYKCEECDKICYNKVRIQTHRQKVHIQNFSHYCETCGKGFYAAVHLNRHVKIAHLKLREHVCEYCKRAFGTRFTLRNHLRQHTNELPFRCEECGDGFKHNVSLKTHLKSKHNVVEKIVCNCEVCGKGFASIAGLNSHMRLHK